MIQSVGKRADDERWVVTERRWSPISPACKSTSAARKTLVVIRLQSTPHQRLPRMSNPYEAPSASVPSLPSPRWLRRFVVLNALLVAVPALAVFCLMAWARIELAIEAARNNGGPVTYQHFYWISVSPASWPLAVYFLIPNAILGAFYMRYRLLRRNSAAGE